MPLALRQGSVVGRCLVSGGAGFVGSHLVDALIEANHDICVVDNLSTGKRENLNSKTEFYFGDIGDVRELWRYSGKPFKYVFHLASLARIQPSIENPFKAHLTNVDGTLAVLEYCRKAKAKLIFASSSSIFKSDILPTSEDAPVHPENPYSLQKLICEQYIQLYGELYGLDYCILRYFNVFGERQLLEGAYAAVVGIFLRQHEKGQALTITGDGEQRRDFTYVKDVAKANLMAMKWNGIFNIGTGINYSINELAEAIGGEKKYIPKRKGEVIATLANSAKAQVQGWSPTISIMEWVDGQR